MTVTMQPFGIVASSPPDPRMSPSREKDVAPILPSEPHFQRSVSMAAGHHGFQGASVSSAVFNLTTSVIGAGIMGLPATMKVLGLPLGVIILIAMGLLTELSIEMLIRTTTVQHVWSYSDLVLQVHGNRWRLLLDVCILINNLGMCVVYLIICGDVLTGTSDGGQVHEGLLESWNGGEAAWFTNRYFIIALLLLTVLLPLLAFRHVDSLHYTSLLAVLLAVAFVLITIALAARNIANGTLQLPSFLPDLSSTQNVMAMMGVVPVMATAYVCHFNVHPIYVELQHRTEATMITVSRWSLALCTAVYLLTSVSGYLLFGAATDADVLVNFDHSLGFQSSDAVNAVVRVTYVFHLLFVFPVIFFSLRNVADDLFFPAAPLPLVDAHGRFWLSTCVELALVYGGAMVIPNITFAFNLTGATTTMVVGMLIPAMLALSDRSGVIVDWECKLAYFMIGLAVVVSITGVTSSVYYLVDRY